MEYRELCRKLAAVYDEREARAIAFLVLEQRFGLSPADVLCGKITQLSAEDRAVLEEITDSLLRGEPVQYVLGEASFAGRQYYVGRGVLIPRPETAELCRLIVADTTVETAHEAVLIPMKPAKKRAVLDIGTGSGCIAITLSLDIQDAVVEAWDISPVAVETARRNADRLNAQVHVCQKDVFSVVEEPMKWDIIVSNPPYICRRESTSMASHVLDYEPEEALFVPDDDALRFYRTISKYAKTSLKEGGRLYFEINPLFADEVRELLKTADFIDVRVVKDSFGKQRFVSCRHL